MDLIVDLEFNNYSNTDTDSIAFSIAYSLSGNLCIDYKNDHVCS
jgi:hypothetical protein